MPKGFFSGSTIAKASAGHNSLIPKCGACGLFKQCASPKMPYSGRGKKGILLVGEAPGKEEDRKGEQFVGKPGEFLEKILDSVGVNMRRDCWLTNALICRPPNNIIEKREMIDWCQPNLINTIRELQPKVVILLGGVSVASLIGRYWKEGVGDTITEWTGWQIPLTTINAWICPTWHPSYIIRLADTRDKKQREFKLASMFFARHLQAAASHTERPWPKGVPDLKSRCDIIYDHREAADMVDDVISRGDPCAWDYEGNTLRPEVDGARILSCSISRLGKRSFAFPWHGRAIKAVRRFIRSDIIKVGANIKFEERWTMWAFGEGVQNWGIDIMNAAHVIDNRKKITGTKFQSFVELGEPSYDEHLRKFLKGSSVDPLNKAEEEIELEDLLLYNAMDSLVEYRIAKKQVKKLRLDLEL